MSGKTEEGNSISYLSDLVRQAAAEYRGDGIGPPKRPQYDQHRAEAARMKAAALMARYFLYQDHDPKIIMRSNNPVFSDPVARMYAEASGISALLEEAPPNHRFEHEDSTRASTVFSLVETLRRTSHPDMIRLLDAELSHMTQIALRVLRNSIYPHVRSTASIASYGNRPAYAEF